MTIATYRRLQLAYHEQAAAHGPRSDEGREAARACTGYLIAHAADWRELLLPPAPPAAVHESATDEEDSPW